MSIPNETLNSIFELLEELRPTPNDPRYRPSEEQVYGEEQPGWYARPGEERNLAADPLAHVKTLSNKITTHLYSEPKFGDMIKGIYSDIVNKRRQLGFDGLRGYNKKGIICACIVIILVSQDTNIDIKKLVTAANKVDTKTIKTSSKMILRYVDTIIDLLKPQNRNNNYNNSLDELKKEIKRISIKMGIPSKNMYKLVRKSSSIDPNLMSYHRPHIIASAFVYDFLIGNNKTIQPNLIKKLEITPLVFKKALFRIFPNYKIRQMASIKI